jgi:hypothetical protein
MKPSDTLKEHGYELTTNNMGTYIWQRLTTDGLENIVINTSPVVVVNHYIKMGNHCLAVALSKEMFNVINDYLSKELYVK